MDADRLARALCKADGKVWWTSDIPACYREQAAALITDGWKFTPGPTPEEYDLAYRLNEFYGEIIGHSVVREA